VLQFRGRRLTVRNLGLPIAIVVYFLFAYLKGVPTAGNDLYLIAGGVALGLIFGVGAGAFTRVYPGEKGIYAKAGLLAATFWATGVVLRTAFSLYASDGGASADREIGRVMHSWDITSSNAIVACLLLMVLGEARGGSPAAPATSACVSAPPLRRVTSQAGTIPRSIARPRYPRVSARSW